jgi:hypothetical protein
MKRLIWLVVLTVAALAASYWLLTTDAHGQGYPLGSDVASTITTSRFNIVGTSSTLVATDNADRVFCKIIQRGTNTIDVPSSSTAPPSTSHPPSPSSKARIRACNWNWQ